MATIMEPETQEQAGAARPTPAGGGAAPAASPGGRRRTVFLIMGVVLLGLGGLGARRWWFNLSHVSTDNAQVDGHIIPILPKVGGFVTLVRTDENRRGPAGGTPFLPVDPGHPGGLAHAGAGPPAGAGRACHKGPGGPAGEPGEPHMSVVPLEDVWITANLKETEVQDVKPGDHVDFTVDAYPGARFTGRVESLSPATGARLSLLPPDNATGNFTKVVQRLPVRVRPEQRDPAHPLRPGMSVVVTITTK